MGRKQTLMTAKKAKVPTAVALRKGGCYGYPSQTGSDAPAAKRMRLTVNLEDAARTGTSGIRSAEARVIVGRPAADLHDNCELRREISHVSR